MCRVGESVRAAKKWSWARTLSKVKTVPSILESVLDHIYVFLDRTLSALLRTVRTRLLIRNSDNFTWNSELAETTWQKSGKVSEWLRTHSEKD